MADVTADLKSIIDRVAREGTLTPAAIKQFDEINTRLESTQTELKTAKERVSAQNGEITILRGKEASLTGELKTAETELAKFRAREFEFTVQERLFASEVQRRCEMRSIVSEIFKNFETARAFQKSVPMPPAYQGGCIQYASESQTETESTRQQP